MAKLTGANDSFDAFVFAAENEAAHIESVCAPEDVDQLYEEDEYGFTGSPETVEELHGLSQKAREDLQAQFNQIGKVDGRVRTKEELEASQRQRGKAELARNQLPLDLLTHFWKDQDLAPEIMRCINLMRRHIERYPGCVDPGVKRYFQEFGNDGHICTQLGMHFNSGSVELFSKASPSIFKTMSLSSRGVPLLWVTLHSPATGYPPLSSFEAGHEKGCHKRGVYLIKTHKPQSRVRYYIGSGRSAKGGMLLRAVQHGSFEYRKQNPQLLYTYLNDPEVTHRVYALCEWPPIDEEPGKEECFDSILVAEALWQLRLGTGHPDKMSPFFNKLLIAYDGFLRRPSRDGGMNVASALEKPRESSFGANRPFRDESSLTSDKRG